MKAGIDPFQQLNDAPAGRDEFRIVRGGSAQKAVTLGIFSLKKFMRTFVMSWTIITYSRTLF